MKLWAGTENRLVPSASAPSIVDVHHASVHMTATCSQGQNANVCCAGDRISHDSRLFTREGLSQLVQVEPLAPIPPAGALMEDYQCQLEAEGACLQVSHQECRNAAACLRLPNFLPAGC